MSFLPSFSTSYLLNDYKILLVFVSYTLYKSNYKVKYIIIIVYVYQYILQYTIYTIYSASKAIFH